LQGAVVRVTREVLEDVNDESQDPEIGLEGREDNGFNFKECEAKPLLS
jgi:hypothetical protein